MLRKWRRRRMYRALKAGMIRSKLAEGRDVTGAEVRAIDAEARRLAGMIKIRL